MSVKNLQPNVDRTLIKVAECVRLFESIYNEMHASTDITQEDGLERDLKTQLKKLQRLRNEIKTLVASNDIKDKAALLENLGLIKTQITKFKAYLFKKEDIIYFGPRVYEKLALEEWSRECLDTLQYQVDAEDLWIDMLLYEEEGKTGVLEKNQNKIEEVKRRIERQKGVMSRLEPISILITQNILSTVQIGTLKDHLDYFMNHADGYDDEDENIFGDFPLDEEECSSLIAECYNSRGQRHGHKAILRYLSSFTSPSLPRTPKHLRVSSVLLPRSMARNKALSFVMQRI
ncbi:Not1 N-terminal domain, CCR4-Not complex component-domain-containing protein [Russula earlei]|uniref:Not1 N-terminal domain, CCR4-Not complex component-domain-containing protein n=1 Tax=Russula earlei TaxID=71964 RepID=A0ACC0UCV1_9AGAM|nr:Not1 N-terminal domain, CCR4-Not complex component-domain-containing protein [Russula earlei]